MAQSGGTMPQELQFEDVRRELGSIEWTLSKEGSMYHARRKKTGTDTDVCWRDVCCFELKEVLGLVHAEIERQASNRASIRSHWEKAAALIVRAAQAERLVRTLPTPGPWKDEYGSELLPELRPLRGPVSRCSECGRPFHQKAGKTYCNDRCSARFRNRGKQKVGNGKSAAENAIARSKKALKGHLESGNCLVRKGKGFCPTCEALQGSLAPWDDMLNHRNWSMDPEAADGMISKRQAGITPKRSTEPAPGASRKALTGRH